MFSPQSNRFAAVFLSLLGLSSLIAEVEDNAETTALASLTLEQVKAEGALHSTYRKKAAQTTDHDAPKADLETFKAEIAPLLQQACVQCHGPDKQKADFRVDTLDPNLIEGDDADWWLEVVDVLSNAEMPPDDEDVELADTDRAAIIDWLSAEIQLASQVRRSEQGHSSFRRLTRYEFNYALQDLLGLPFDFAKDLPPETQSEDGFQNSSEMLQMTAMQFEMYRDLARKALKKATVADPKPDPIYYDIAMETAAARGWKSHEANVKKARSRHKNDPEALEKELRKLEAKLLGKHNGAHYRNLESGKSVPASWSYGGARYAWKPMTQRPEFPTEFSDVAIIPSRQRLIIDLGDHLPDRGNLRVRLRASRIADDTEGIPSLRLFFGHQASNNSHASEQVSEVDIAVTAPTDDPQLVEWEIPLSEVIRNPYRNVTELGKTPNPAEYVMLLNSSVTPANVRIDHVEITAPHYPQWPPASHQRIFIDTQNRADEPGYAREVLANFMPQAWRRPVSETELDQKLALFTTIRPGYEHFEDAMIEVLAGVIASPKFLYLAQSDAAPDDGHISDQELASRLAMFLWSSIPDQELLSLAESQSLRKPQTLVAQTERMLADPRAERFSRHFVRQWLGMQLLDYLNVDKKRFRQFDEDLKAAMQQEPIAFFHEILGENGSVMDFLHADYLMVNERLARHYGFRDVHGTHFRKYPITSDTPRGGLLTQAGLLAMNSDGKDSHPLKRGIWLLENLLHDPPPPPPPAVPEIDLTDPDILKLTLKERMEDHRNDPACMSCHAKIDPWGIAFENYDALGSWREEIGKDPVDASSVLFNKQELHGMDGLKRFLLANRQDQFARSMVYKLSSYALGRPLSFADRADLEQITAEFRQQDDKLATLITLLVTSDLFLSK